MTDKIISDEFNFEFRGSSSSERFNTIHGQFNDAILHLGEQHDEVLTRINTYMKAAYYGNVGNSLFNSYVREELETYKRHYSDNLRENTNYKLLYTNMYATDTVIEGTLRHNQVYGHMCLGYSDVAAKVKLITDADGRRVPSPSCKIYIDGVLQDSSEQIYNILKDENYEVWIEDSEGVRGQYVQPFAKTQVNIQKIYQASADPLGRVVATAKQVTVELPRGINPRMNAIELAPFPAGAMTVEQLQYLTAGNVWESVPGFNTAGDTFAMEQFYHFNYLDYNDQIRVGLSPFEALHRPSGRRMSVYGLRSFRPYYINYTDTGETIFKLSAEGQINNLVEFIPEEMFDLSPMPDFDDLTTHPVEFRVYDADPRVGGTLLWSSTTDVNPLRRSDTTLPVASRPSSLFVKVTMSKYLETTPVLKKLAIVYS